MFFEAGRMTLWLGAIAQVLALSYIGSAHAQRWDHQRTDWYMNNWERQREDHNRRERERREDATAAGVVVGVVGTAVLAGVIAAAAKREKDERSRADYCLSRYGNYDRATDTYRARDGYAYRCE
ncbi:hypothetical protein [Acidovorax cavernicola]|uniref:Lectin-like protein BA14k n=1 Tax=Acidovorax cavernicola TaxID=1675792 RepID=A0A9X8D769_9BURK|nr:hypothetical protein [Acidovorax cavernicola]RIX83183.1 hypothetical protein D3H34_07025 [Acidovorax cavernicola]